MNEREEEIVAEVSREFKHLGKMDAWIQTDRIVLTFFDHGLTVVRHLRSGESDTGPATRALLRFLESAAGGCPDCSLKAEVETMRFSVAQLLRECRSLNARVTAVQGKGRDRRA